MTNGSSTVNDELQIYRGMPIGVTKNGQIIYTSARDVGNIAAGYMAAINKLPWNIARMGFDGYQIFGPILKSIRNISKIKFKREGLSTQNAEYYGWRMGHNRASKSKK